MNIFITSSDFWTSLDLSGGFLKFFKQSRQSNEACKFENSLKNYLKYLNYRTFGKNHEILIEKWQKIQQSFLCKCTSRTSDHNHARDILTSMTQAFEFITSKEVVIAPWSKKPDVEIVDPKGEFFEHLLRCNSSSSLSTSSEVQEGRV